LVDEKKEFVHLNKAGMTVASLADVDKRVLLGNDPQQKIIHSLESINYLKVDPGNFVEFDSETSDTTIKIK
jgi:hypothetical protein